MPAPTPRPCRPRLAPTASRSPRRLARRPPWRPGADPGPAGGARQRDPVQAGLRAGQRRGSGGRRDAAERSRFRRRRHGELALARRHRGRAQAQGGRDLRQHRRCLQAAAPPAGPGHPEQAAQRLAVARAGAPLQEAQGRHHRRGEVAAAQPGAHRRAGGAALRHQQAPRGL